MVERCALSGSDLKIKFRLTSLCLFIYTCIYIYICMYLRIYDVDVFAGTFNMPTSYQ